MPDGTVTDALWDEHVLLPGEVVIVAICASRTGPCQTFGPTVDAIATDLRDTATVVTIDLDENPAIGRRYDVSSLPTLLVFRDGALVGRLTGARPKARLLRELRPYLD